MYQIKCDAHGNILFCSLKQYFCNVDVLVADTITIDDVFISQVLRLATASLMSQVPRRVF